MEQPIRIFIADGSRDSVELLRILLEREEDFSVVGTACRGDDALQRFPGSGTELLLCDLLLPGLDGLSLLRRLKADGTLKHAIVLSGFFNDSIARPISAVADNYLPKPCRALLEARVMPHLDGFRYLRSALERTCATPALLRGVTKSLYRDVAKEFNTTPACVERSMRAAIDRAWTRMDDDVRLRIFGPEAASRDKAPSNVPFLTAMTAYIENTGGVPRRCGGL